MDLQTGALSDPQTDAGSSPVGVRDRARLRIAREQRMLERLAEIGMSRAEALDSDLDGLAYDRISRSVRMTVLLQARLDTALERLEDIAEDEARERDRKSGRARKAFEFARKARVQLVVERVAQGEHPGDGETVDRLVVEACERMRDDEDFAALLSGPVSEAIDHLCRELGLSPDWPQLIQTTWAQEEIASGKVGAPLAAAIRPAVPAPDGPPRRFSEVGDTRTFVVPPLPPLKRRRSG